MHTSIPPVTPPPPPSHRHQATAEPYAFYIAKSFMNKASVEHIDGSTWAAISSWNGKYLDSQDDNKQWVERKQMWKSFLATLEEK